MLAVPGRDCFDGKIVSWRLSRSPDAAMADGMLLDAIATLGNGERPVIHSDRGCITGGPDGSASARSTG